MAKAKDSQSSKAHGAIPAAPSKHDALMARTSFWLAAGLSNPLAHESGRRAAEYMSAVVTRRTGWDKPRTEVGEPASLAMRDVEMALEDFAYAIAQELSSDEWLFFLRQAPYLFKG